MRVLGVSGSPRVGGNTDVLIRAALGALAEEGFETDFLSLARRPIMPCMACMGCAEGDELRCRQHDPAFEGMKTVDDLARNMGWLMRKLA